MLLLFPSVVRSCPCSSWVTTNTAFTLVWEDEAFIHSGTSTYTVHLLLMTNYILFFIVFDLLPSLHEIPYFQPIHACKPLMIPTAICLQHAYTLYMKGTSIWTRLLLDSADGDKTTDCDSTLSSTLQHPSCFVVFTLFSLLVWDSTALLACWIDAVPCQMMLYCSNSWSCLAERTPLCAQMDTIQTNWKKSLCELGRTLGCIVRAQDLLLGLQGTENKHHFTKQSRLLWSTFQNKSHTWSSVKFIIQGLIVSLK